MPPRLQRPDASTLLKRAHSADTSKSGTPVPDRVTTPDEESLPDFLRQSDTGRWSTLDLKQRDRLDESKTHFSKSFWTQAASASVLARNRYEDIRPWDRRRVKLRVPEGYSDYINASPILLQCSSTGQNRRYIAAQGPKKNSVQHFWQMVWHETEHVAVVIMLTKLAEGPRDKCFKYFPDSGNSESMEMRFTDEEGKELEATLRVVGASWHERSMTDIRTLQLTCDGESKTVHHLFFQGWPDYGVPEAADRSALLELIQLSRTKNMGWENPRIVHCSAGVGRTGSFIAIEHLLAELEVGSMDDPTDLEDPVFDTIEQLRQQRMTMVQSMIQYRFIYDLIAEAYRARLREKLIADKVKDMTGSIRSPGVGEPAHKAMKFTRAVRGVFSNIRARSSSSKGTKQDNKKSESEDSMSQPAIDSDGNPDNSVLLSEASDPRDATELDEELISETFQDANEDPASSCQSPEQDYGPVGMEELSQGELAESGDEADSHMRSQLPDAPPLEQNLI